MESYILIMPMIFELMLELIDHHTGNLSKEAENSKNFKGI
jgi:hypothetical protein